MPLNFIHPCFPFAFVFGEVNISRNALTHLENHLLRVLVVIIGETVENLSHASEEEGFVRCVLRRPRTCANKNASRPVGAVHGGSRQFRGHQFHHFPTDKGICLVLIAFVHIINYS